MTQEVAKPENEGTLTNERFQLLQSARDLIVSTPEQHETAQRFIEQTYGFEKRVRSFMDDDIAKANELHKSLTGKRRALLEASAEARKVASQKTVAFEDQEKKRAELAAAEEQAKAMEAEREHQLDRAVSLEAVGAPELAEEVLNEPAVVPRPIEAPNLSQVGDLTTRSHWRGELIKPEEASFKKLVEHVAKNPEFLEVLKLNQGALNRLAGTLKRRLNLPGVVVIEDKKKQRAGKR